MREMHRQVGDLEIDEHGVVRRGLLVRHLVLPVVKRARVFRGCAHGARAGICRPSANLEYVLKDLFHRPRRNPKSGETRLVRRCDCVDLHQVHLITREGCSW